MRGVFDDIMESIEIVCSIFDGRCQPPTDSALNLAAAAGSKSTYRTYLRSVVLVLGLSVLLLRLRLLSCSLLFSPRWGGWAPRLFFFTVLFSVVCVRLLKCTRRSR